MGGIRRHAQPSHGTRQSRHCVSAVQGAAFSNDDDLIDSQLASCATSFRTDTSIIRVENQVMLTRLVVAAVSFMLAAPTLAEAQQDKSKIILGYSKCAHCFPMALTPGLTDKLTIEPIGFNTDSDVLTALVSKSVDVAQVTYLHFITALDKGFDVVAISGQINGGSEILVQPTLALAAGDWPR